MQSRELGRLLGLPQDSTSSLAPCPRALWVPVDSHPFASAPKVPGLHVLLCPIPSRHPSALYCSGGPDPKAADGSGAPAGALSFEVSTYCSLGLWESSHGPPPGSYLGLRSRPTRAAAVPGFPLPTVQAILLPPPRACEAARGTVGGQWLPSVQGTAAVLVQGCQPCWKGEAPAGRGRQTGHSSIPGQGQRGGPYKRGLQGGPLNVQGKRRTAREQHRTGPALTRPLDRGQQLRLERAVARPLGPSASTSMYYPRP